MDVDAAGRRVQLSDGRVVRIRPIRATDAEALQAFDAGLCDRSRRLRYLGWMPPMSAEQAASMADLDARRRFALVAVAAGPRLVADCRLVRLEDERDRAEVAIAVADDYQDVGLGTAMLRSMLDIAARQRLGEVFAEVRYDNKRMMHVLRRLGFDRGRWEHGVVTFTCRPAEWARARMSRRWKRTVATATVASRSSIVI